jgi:hypothetical protein
VQSAALAEQVFGRWFRANVALLPATTTDVVAEVNGVAIAAYGTPYPTALVEYKLPSRDLLLLTPGPAIVVFWNRAELLPFQTPVDEDGVETDPGIAIPEASYWTYRATLATGVIEQRLRLRNAPSPGDVVRALFYIKDFT